MSIAATPALYCGPYGTLYDLAMAKMELMGIESTRKVLGKRVDLAIEQQILTVMTKHGQPAAAIVPMDLLRRAMDCLGEPLDLALPASEPDSTRPDSG